MLELTKEQKIRRNEYQRNYRLVNKSFITFKNREKKLFQLLFQTEDIITRLVNEYLRKNEGVRNE